MCQSAYVGVAGNIYTVKGLSSSQFEDSGDFHQKSPKKFVKIMPKEDEPLVS